MIIRRIILIGQLAKVVDDCDKASIFTSARHIKSMSLQVLGKPEILI